jgi:multisubunit Na+/H+ antiporter MnhF subunit
MPALTEAVLLSALAVLGVGIVCCVVRICLGPSRLDQVPAFDCIVLNVVWSGSCS